MTIRTIVDFAKKHVVQLELEFLKVFTSNYDGWGKNRADFRSEVLQVRYDPCSGLLGKLTLLDRHI